MRATSVLTSSVWGLCLALAGCGGGGVNVPEGPMPEGGSFTGVWHSPQYGEMHMVQSGTNVVGEYTKDERNGRIQGTVRGNVMTFEWTERRELVAGRPNITRGRGYFRYSIGQDRDHYITGEWGVDDRMNGGGAWNAVRDRRRRPQVSSGGSGRSAGDENVEEFDTATDSDGSGGSSGGSGESGRGGSRGGDSDLDLGDL